MHLPLLSLRICWPPCTACMESHLTMHLLSRRVCMCVYPCFQGPHTNFLKKNYARGSGTFGLPNPTKLQPFVRIWLKGTSITYLLTYTIERWRQSSSADLSVGSLSASLPLWPLWPMSLWELPSSTTGGFPLFYVLIHINFWENLNYPDISVTQKQFWPVVLGPL